MMVCHFDLSQIPHQSDFLISTELGVTPLIPFLLSRMAENKDCTESNTENLQLTGALALNGKIQNHIYEPKVLRF